MPCWYFEKKEIKNTPSYKDGIDSFTESRYRREGARFIIDAGTKMGLRYDTCATGVVYFHRFYMFHSFKEFHRYITAACCLFLAGKVEETPKKCKDIIKICQNLLSPTLFTVFGNDPKEEVMTMERILLQTIKFDLQVEHPYSSLLKFAKIIKGDKDKIQKLVQMAWTFINDSLCTTLCLQWEPEITAVSLMYLATRLTKFDIQDWNGKTPGTKLKWWESLVEDMTVDLMEDICHKVLDLYSNNPPIREDSPPTTPSKKSGARDTPPPPPPAKRSGPNTPADGVPEIKVPRSESQTRKDTPNRGGSSSGGSKPQSLSQSSSSSHHSSTEGGKSKSQSGSHGQSTSSSQPPFSKSEQSAVNPYMSSQMFSSSFMSQEGSKSIQTLMGGGQEGVAPAKPPPVAADVYGNVTAIPPTQPPPTMGQYPTQTTQYSNPQYPQGLYPQASAAAPYQQQPAYGTQPTQPGYPSSQPYQATAAVPAAPVPTQGYPPASYPQNYPQQPQIQPYMQPYQPPPQIPTSGYNQVPQQPSYNQGQLQPQQQHYQPQQQPPQQHMPPNPRIPMSNPARGPRPQSQPNQPQPASTNSGLTVRISGRR